VESLYRRHVSKILPFLSHSRQIKIIEIMNEPRGKMATQN